MKQLPMSGSDDFAPVSPKRPNQRTRKLDFYAVLSPSCKETEIVDRVQRQALGWLEAYGLPRPVVRIMLAMHNNEPCSAIVLANKSGMSAPQLSLNLKELIECGIVVADMDPDSPNKYQLTFTELGTRAVEALVEARDVAVGAALGGFSSGQRSKFETMLYQRMNWS